MKTKFLFVATLLSGLFLSAGYSQVDSLDHAIEEDEIKIRPIRLGAKLGFPNLIGGNLEYVSPILKSKLALNVDYSGIKIDEAGEEGFEDSGSSVYDYSYWGAGVNYYLFKPGKGLYAGVSYTDFKFNLTEENYYVEEGDRYGTGYSNFSHNTFNLKLGAKLGGLFYFRPEVGLSLKSLPQSYNVNIQFEDGTQEERIEEFDTEGSALGMLFSGVIANVGIGFAF